MPDAKVWSDEEILEMWEQAARELEGFQQHLASNDKTKAVGLRLALGLAGQRFQQRKGSTEVPKATRVHATLRVWPSMCEELRDLQATLEAKSGITAAQLGMALQLAEERIQQVET